MSSDYNEKLPQGLYDAILDKGLQELLSSYPELRTVLKKLEPEEEPSRYAKFVMQIIEKALKQEKDPAARLGICNKIISLVSSGEKTEYLKSHKIIQTEKSLLTEITPTHYATKGLPSKK